MEVQGTVKFKGETETFGTDFTKCNLVVTTDEQYPQHILIEFVKDKIALLNNYKLGDSVKVGVNLRGREWVNPQGETKYFNSIQGWKIDKAEASNVPAPSQQAFEPATDLKKEDHDNLPF